VSSAYVLKSDMDRCSPVDAVVKYLSVYLLGGNRNRGFRGRACVRALFMVNEGYVVH